MTCYSTTSSYLFILVLLLLTNIAASHQDCEESRCRHDHALLQLGPVQLCVNRIDYKDQTLELYDPQGCLPRQILKLHQHNSSIAPFVSHSPDSPSPNNITFLNCSSVDQRYLHNDFEYTEFLVGNKFDYLSKQDMFCCPIYAGRSEDDFVGSDLLSCTKILDTTSLLNFPDDLQQNSLRLRWLEPNCTSCEANGMKCKLRNKGTLHDVECLPRDPIIPKSAIIVASGSIGGSILLVLAVLASFHIYRYFRTKGEDEARVEKFLNDYQALKPTRFSYADINRITNGFKDKLGEGAHGAVFKGKLSDEILVAVKILNNSEESDGREFINEVGTMGKIHHVNVVRLLGYCADGFHRALVYKFFPNGSLQNFLCPPDNKDLFLGWEKLHKIAIGIARGIEYLHLGCDHQILHFDINPHNMLLDENFNPKISDFGLAKLCSKNQSAISISAARGTLGYIAPEVFSRNFGNVSYKSDIYSFGMLLVEMVGGRNNTSTSQENVQVLYPEWIHDLIEGGDIHIQIEGEEDNRIAKKLAIVALWCIQWHPVDRPSIKTVVQMLEGEGDKLQVPPSPSDSSSINASAIVPPRRLNFELEVIHELE